MMNLTTIRVGHIDNEAPLEHYSAVYYQATVTAEAASRAEEVAEVARKAAEEALSKVEEALVKAVIKRLTRWEWIATLVIINLAIVFAAVLFAVAIGQAV